MRYNSAISFILIFLSILTAGVHFEIQDVDTDAGSLNIYMNNEIDCEVPRSKPWVDFRYSCPQWLWFFCSI